MASRTRVRPVESSAGKGPRAAQTAGGQADHHGRVIDMSKRICSIGGCGKPHVSRGWCAPHYQAWYKYGDPLVVRVRHRSARDRFWERVDRPDSGCWNWTGYRSELGYGRFYPVGKKRVPAHRFAYELLVGPIPEGLVLDHLCRNASCVNPAHLEPVSQRENVLRGLAPTAINAIKTQCIHGHEYTPENTMRQKHGRECRTCYNRRRRERYARRAV